MRIEGSKGLLGLVVGLLMIGACDQDRSALPTPGSGGTAAASGGGSGGATGTGGLPTGGSDGGQSAGGTGGGGATGTGGQSAGGSGGGGAPGAGGTAGSTGAGGGFLDGDRVCHEDLSQIECLPSYDDQVARGCTWRLDDLVYPPGFPHGAAGGTCAGYLVFAYRFTFGSFDCYYDPATRVLVGGMTCTDYNVYCDGYAFCHAGGVAVKRCDFSTYAALCPTPGSGGATGSGGAAGSDGATGSGGAAGSGGATGSGGAAGNAG